MDEVADVSPGSRRMSASQSAYFEEESPFFHAFANRFSLDPGVVYLMAGQKGSQPDSVRKRYQEGLDQIARDPFPVHLEPTATTRERIANLKVRYVHRNPAYNPTTPPARMGRESTPGRQGCAIRDVVVDTREIWV